MSSKRRRLRKNAQRSQAHDTDLSQSLTCVRVVCLNGPDTLRLPHVAAKLDEFLDGSPKWTLVGACAAKSLGLVQRVLSRLSLEPVASGLRRPGFRRWQFEASMMKAAAAGNLDVVKLLVTHFKNFHVAEAVVMVAASRGRSEILQWVIGRCQLVDWPVEALFFAVQAGNLKMAKWLQANSLMPPLNELDKCAVAVAKQGDLEMLKWVCSVDAGFEDDGAQKHVNPWQVVNNAVDMGHLEMLKWIFKQPNGTAHTLEEDDSQEELEIQIHASEAVRRGHFDVLKWLIPKHRDLCCFDKADAVAAETGRLDILRWICANNLVDEPTWSTFENAAENGHLDVLKWMLDQEQCYKYGRAINEAARNGHLEVVKWLHENIPVRSTKTAMKVAAESGHLDIVKFLYAVGYGWCHFDVMAAALAYGNLEVAKWLLHHTNLGNTNPGNVETVKCLWMRARAGDLETIQWVHKQ
jgi:hypothetical protein